MTDTRQCHTCGAPLPDDAPAGLCPTCLVKAGLESAAPGEPPGDPTAAASGPIFEPPSIDALTTLFPKLEILESWAPAAWRRSTRPGSPLLTALWR